MKWTWSTINEFVWRYSRKPSQDYPSPGIYLNPGPHEYKAGQLITRRRRSGVFGSVSIDKCPWYATVFPALQLTASSDISTTHMPDPNRLNSQSTQAFWSHYMFRCHDVPSVRKHATHFRFVFKGLSKSAPAVTYRLQVSGGLLHTFHADIA